MQKRVVFPFHDRDGRIIGYAGYNPSNGSWKYPPPEKFNPTLELYGYYQAFENSPATMIALCRDPLAALRYRAKVHGEIPVVAITTVEFSEDGGFGPNRRKYAVDVDAKPTRLFGAQIRQ